MEQRFESYYNYCNLFNYILNADGPAPLELPNQWLWDIIDEFIYQVAGQPWVNLEYSITGPNKEQLLTVVRVIKKIQGHSPSPF